jgi:8-oxo-dGTP pyrophosphatase MutT (NUDIX family)
MIHAAGVLFETPDKRILFLRRSGEGDQAGIWAFPGGKIEDGETPQQAAVRECAEEMGGGPGIDDLEQIAHTQDRGVDYTTFRCEVAEPFTPRLNAEHTEHAWRLPDDAPEPLHPGVKALLGHAARKDAAPDLARAPKEYKGSIPAAPASDDVEQVLSANFEHGVSIGPRTVPTARLKGGVRLSDPTQQARVETLVEKMRGPGGHIARPIVDTDGNVLEGQHRLEAMRQLGVTHAPVHLVRDLAKDISLAHLHEAITAAQPMHSDQRHQLTRSVLEALADEKTPARVRENYEAPKGFEKGWHGALDHLEKGASRKDAAVPRDELDIARAIRDGELPSPQHYENVWLFALRITGTGAAYRLELNEYVWRDPKLYLNDDFLARCNGLAVILEHPEKNQLDSEEYRDRNIGSIMLPYIKGDEVWGIAKILDDAGAAIMRERQLSTSPAVVFSTPGVNKQKRLDDGGTLLIEGKPSLLDHLAICEQGVWDKGGKPTGIDNSATSDGEPTMADEKDDKKEHEAKERERADKARADAEAHQGRTLDKLLERVDAMHTRLDALEGGFGTVDPGGEEGDADLEQQGRELIKEGEAEEEEGKLLEQEGKGGAGEAEGAEGAQMPPEAIGDARKARKDAARALADNAKLRAQLDALSRRMPRILSDADHAQMAEAQATADHVYSAFGDAAPRPLQGESLLAYRRRLAGKMQAHSAAWKGISLGELPAPALAVAERQIYADALTAARTPADLPADQLREVITVDETGRRIKSFVGQPRAWLQDFACTRRRVAGIRNN